jgi:hypothetical protein
MSLRSWRGGSVWLVLLASSLACASAPSIASVAVFPSPDGQLALRGPATPTPTDGGIRMICTGASCTVCDTLIDIRVYPAAAGTAFASYRTQGTMHGPVELVAVTFQDSVSLVQAG